MSFRLVANSVTLNALERHIALTAA